MTARPRMMTTEHRRGRVAARCVRWFHAGLASTTSGPSTAVAPIACPDGKLALVSIATGSSNTGRARSMTSFMRRLITPAPAPVRHQPQRLATPAEARWQRCGAAEDQHHQPQRRAQPRHRRGSVGDHAQARADTPWASVTNWRSSVAVGLPTAQWTATSRRRRVMKIEIAAT